MRPLTIGFNPYQLLEPDRILIIIIISISSSSISSNSNSSHSNNSNYINRPNNTCNLYLGHDLVRYI